MDVTPVHTHCRTHVEFLEALSPLRPEFNPDYGWIFRGNWLEEFKLVPKALRPEVDLPKVVGFQVPTPAENPANHLRDRRFHEYMILKKFYRQLDRSGFPIPDDSSTLRRFIERDASGWDFFSLAQYQDTWWPSDELIGLMALAQHYGLPTRLLDWTRNPYRAAFFASKDVLAHICNDTIPHRPISMTENLAVWAVQISTIEFGSMGARQTKGLAIETVTASTATNPNLRAQEALFTVFRTKYKKYDPALDAMPLDRQAKETCGEVTTAGVGMPSRLATPFHKFTLPLNEAPRLAEALRRLGVTSASIFPSIQGCSAAVEEAGRIERALRAVKTA
jgi:hypothetical protein